MHIYRTIVSFSNNPGKFNVPKSLLCDNITKETNKQILYHIHNKYIYKCIYITNAFTLVIKHIYSSLNLLNLIEDIKCTE